MSSKYSQQLFNHPEQSATDAPKTVSKRAIQKTAEALGDFIGNKITDKITKISRTLPQNILETVKNENDKEILKEKNVSPAERQKIVDLRLI